MLDDPCIKLSDLFSRFLKKPSACPLEFLPFFVGNPPVDMAIIKPKEVNPVIVD